jgi:quercetin dioxygenase-like cupin family protein
MTSGILHKAGAGNSYWVLGDLYTFKVTGKETQGATTVIDQIIQPRSGPPPHIHHREDEAFYVLEGAFQFMCGDQRTTLQTGAFAYIPKGTLHTFKNISDKPGRLLVTITPAGLEDFFYKIGSPATNLNSPPPFDPAVINKLMSIVNDYHMEVILP